MDDECCKRHSLVRQRVGTTSRRHAFMLLVDQCWRCLYIVNVLSPMTWKQENWVRRWNDKRSRKDKM